MADHPLRSANHLSLGRPLPYQQANSTQAYHLAVARGHLSLRRDLCSINLNFSRVSFTKWEILTRYSPVRHFTRSRRNFLVRLACVKHAASVHSEPGSNSPYRNLKRSSHNPDKFVIFDFLSVTLSHVYVKELIFLLHFPFAFFRTCFIDYLIRILMQAF